jgi:methanogenic corrinoid protein MtbC1
VFATPTDERHELGLLSAALTAMGAGANSIYLGAELPVEEMLRAVSDAAAVALALSLVTIRASQARRTVAELRGGLPHETLLWLGGPAARDLAAIDGVEQIERLEELERRVALLAFEKPDLR